MGIQVNVSTIRKFLHKNHISRQKMWITALQGDEFLRREVYH